MTTYTDTISDGPDLTCPYNSNHVIPNRKFTAHLLECAKINGNPDYWTCPFHAKHRIIKYEMWEHISLCPFMEKGVVTTEQLAEYEKLWKKNPNRRHTERKVNDEDEDGYLKKTHQNLQQQQTNQSNN